MSWTVEVVTHGGDWRGNQLRFATKGEAEANADDLIQRWRTVRAARVVENLEPVNLRWSNGELTQPLEPGPKSVDEYTAIVVASGRSVSDICLPLLTLCGARTVAVNNAVRYAQFANYVFTLDTSDLEERLRLPFFAGRRVAAVPADYFHRRHRRSGRFKKVRRPAPNVRYVDRVGFTSIDPTDAIMTGCSGFGALQFAYKFLGAKEIFLLGCDHDDQGRYFYGDEPDEKQSGNWRTALTHWNRLSLPDGVKVWNVSKRSNIASFPKVDWQLAAHLLGLPSIPVVTVLKCGGEYHEGHVQWLQRQVGFPILCLTDSLRPMNEVVSIPLIHDWPGWWSKMELFRDDLCLGNFLYVDLDTVIIGGIPNAFRTMSETEMLSDLYGHPWIQSCLMFLHHSSRQTVWESFSANPEKAIQEFGSGGDQIFIDRFLGSAKRLEQTLPGAIISYKADILKNRFHRPNAGSLKTARFVCFHGQPRPWDVQEPWAPKL